MSSKSFEDRMRERLNEANIQPRPEVWKGLEARLPKKEKRWPFWLWIMEGGFIALLMILWCFPNISNSSQTNMMAIGSEKISPKYVDSSTLTPKDETNSATRLKKADDSANNHQAQENIPSPQEDAAVSNLEKTPTQRILNQSLAIRTYSLRDRINLSQINAKSTKIESQLPNYHPKKQNVAPYKFSRWAVNFHHHISNQAKPIDFLQIRTEDLTVAGVVPRNDTLYTLDQPKRYFHFAADVEYFFHPKWSVQTGVGLMISEVGKVEQQIYPQGVLQDTMILYNGGNVQDLANQIIENTEGSFRSRRLSIPLYINHYIHKGRSAFTLSLGGMYSRSLRKAETLNEINAAFRSESLPDPVVNPIPPTSDFYLTQRKNQFHLLGRTLYQYQFTPALGIYGGPSIRYNLKPEYTSNLITDDQKWQLGLEFGVKWWLR